MKKHFTSILSTLSMIAASTAMAQNATTTAMIVTNSGDVMNVYHLDYSPADYCYYTLTPEDDAALSRIAKKDVMIIKLSDGTKVDPNATAAAPAATAAVTSGQPSGPMCIEEQRAYWQKHVVATHHAVSDIETDKKGNRYVRVEDGRGQFLYMRLVEDSDKELEVMEPSGKMEDYHLTSYVIPEYVTIGNDTYTVKYIGPEAFRGEDVTNVVLPVTLEKIGSAAFSLTKLTDVYLPDSLKEIEASAFARTNLSQVVLPEGIGYVGYSAFYAVGLGKTIKELYIPKGIKKIAQTAFLFLGANTSYRGYYQGNLTGLPDFVTEGNCTSFGIDEEAVRSYQARHK